MTCCNENQPWIMTYSGIHFTPFDPQEDQIKLIDIAHSLSMLCRFNGHCNKFWSVAQHCLLGSYLIDDEHKLEFLLHDAAEAYIGDIGHPVKINLSYTDKAVFNINRNIEYVENKILNKIMKKYAGKDFIKMQDEVKEMDVKLCLMEGEYLGMKISEWNDLDNINLNEFYYQWNVNRIEMLKLLKLNINQIKDLYLKRYTELI